MNPEQITDHHRRRLALVYVRQSSAHQVIHHQESQRRQRHFVQRAIQLGWPPDRIQVVDDDLGQSGSRSGQRSGFEEMVSRTALGQIGLILALEVSRLARSNRDWYHLLDVCAITTTLIGDEEAVYDPKSYNDRLLLGLKGTMSEAELHLIRQRLVEATRAKARRGQLQRKLAPGYIWDELGRMQKDPDEQVVSAIARVFERFDQVGTIHQAHYEVGLARRQYDAVDPENRLVVRELERRFEKALHGWEAVEAEASERLGKLEATMSEAEEQLLKSYAKDLGRLWHAPTTRVQDRKRMARCLLEKIVVSVPPEAQSLKAEVHWKGGERTGIEVARGQTGVHRYVSDPELIELVRKLAQEFSDEPIARILYRKRLKTPKGHAFKAYHVANVRRGYGIAPGPCVPLQGQDIYTAEEAAERLGVSRCTVIRWVEVGLLRGRQMTDGAPWRIPVSPEDIKRLKPADADPAWLPLKGAAQAMGVSQQTVLQKLKSGELEGVRVQTGRRSAWRIRLPQGTYDNQPTLL